MFIRHLLSALALSTIASPTFAQTAPLLNDDELARTREQVKQQIGELTDARVEAVRRQLAASQPANGTAAQVNGARPSMPRLDAIPAPQVQPQVDIGALADRYLDQAKPFNPQALIAPAKLYIFVTLAMPAQNLKALAIQAQKAGATLVLRGFVDDSMKKTTAALSTVLGASQGGVSVDPEAFDRFGVTKAPTFVLEKASPAATPSCTGKSCVPSEGYARLSGDVSLDYALQRIEQRAPRFKPEAQAFLQRLKG
jgi:conjugal transfer pilus assembly protein TrbC